MKSLTESILSTSNVGLNSKIRKWLEENEVMPSWRDEYEIKNGVIYPVKDATVRLFENDNYDELPKYIQFGDGEYDLIIGSNRIKSFRNMPKEVKNLTFATDCYMLLPEINIKVKYCVHFSNISNIKFNKNSKIIYSGPKILNNKQSAADSIVIQEYPFECYNYNVFYNFHNIELGYTTQNISGNGFAESIYKWIMNKIKRKRYKPEYIKNPIILPIEESSLIDDRIMLLGIDKSISFIKVQFWENYSHKTIFLTKEKIKTNLSKTELRWVAI